MTMFSDIVNEYDLNRGIEDKFIKKQTNEKGLSIYNYTDPAMYTKGAWDNQAVRKCRGIVVGIEGEVLARPYEKFFNYGQPESGELDLDAPVEVTDKMDGSMLSLWWNPITKQPQFSTRGSFNSDQSNDANKWLRENVHDVLSGDIETTLTEWTLVLEWISPDNRIVLNYGDKHGAALLGAVHIDTGKYIGPNDTILRNFWKGETTNTFREYSTLREALQAPPRDNAEGVVVRYLDEPRMVKIKQNDYIQRHRIMYGLSNQAMWTDMAVRECKEYVSEPKHWGTFLGIDPSVAQAVLDRGDATLLDILKEVDSMPDEVYDMVEDYMKELRLKFADEMATISILLLRAATVDGRDRYEMLKDHYASTAILGFLRGAGEYGRIEASVWKHLRPKGTDNVLRQPSEDNS